jgi:hypothetical protein
MKDYLHFRREGVEVLCAVMAGGSEREAKFKVGLVKRQYPVPSKARPNETPDEEDLEIGTGVMNRYERRLKMETALTIEKD